jgi:hypothetical protein
MRPREVLCIDAIVCSSRLYELLCCCFVYATLCSVYISKHASNQLMSVKVKCEEVNGEVVVNL